MSRALECGLDLERSTRGKDASTMARDVVLVHGMSHGAWCWELLGPRLQRAGHRVLAVDLPGHGRRVHERARASVAGYAQAVADAMMLAGAHDAIVVGHSMSGIVIPKVAELVPARIAHLSPPSCFRTVAGIWPRSFRCRCASSSPATRVPAAVSSSTRRCWHGLGG
jgi:pimeloyl-ACP methyl ester carboxylesterase